MASRQLRCPACSNETRFHRSRTRLWDLVFMLFGLRAYRCMSCYKRFHSWRKPQVSVRSRPYEAGSHS